MKLLQNILSTIDFSSSSEKVIDKSILLAKKFNSNITLFHVFEGKSLSDDVKKLVYDTVNSKLKVISERINGEGVPVKAIIIKEGVPFEEIINEAHHHDYNVIVAGEGDSKNEAKFKLGTTVLKLMRKNHVPLWVVKNESVKGIRKIACPIDFSDASLRALNNAKTLAKRFNAELNIISVYEPIYVSNPWINVDNVKENETSITAQKVKLQDLTQRVNLEDVNFNVKLLKGEPYNEILKYIQKNNIDLLLMGTTGKTALSRLLIGSVTEKVTREVPCSFITTKATDITQGYIESNLQSIESIIQSAKNLYEKQKYEEAIEKYTIGLQQHPDNIPIIKGLIETNKKLGNLQKVDHYTSYAKEVILRIWGKDYLNKFDL